MQLRGEKVRHDGSQGGEEGGQEHADFPHVDGDVDRVEKVVDDAGGDHEARVDGSPNDPTKGIPGPVVKPVVETVESIISQVLGCAVVEVGIELVNDGFKPAGRKLEQVEQHLLRYEFDVDKKGENVLFKSL